MSKEIIMLIDTVRVKEHCKPTYIILEDLVIHELSMILPHMYISDCDHTRMHSEVISGLTLSEYREYVTFIRNLYRLVSYVTNTIDGILIYKLEMKINYILIHIGVDKSTNHNTQDNNPSVINK